MKVFYTLLFIGSCLLLCNDIQAQELTCADAESNPSLEDCSSGASETGVPGDGVIQVDCSIKVSMSIL